MRLLQNRKLMGVFWMLFCIATILLMLNAADHPSVLHTLPLPVQLFISPLMLFVQWHLLLRYRGELQSLLSKLPLPNSVVYLILGMFLAFVLGNNFAISFDIDGQDLHPNPFMNMFLYVGPYGGLLLALYFLRHWYTFDFMHVFWLTGFLGAIQEQGYIIPLSLIGGDLLTFSILIFNVIPAYGVAFGSIWIIMPPERLPNGIRRIGIPGILLFLILGILAFYLFAALWYGLLDSLLGTNFLEL